MSDETVIRPPDRPQGGGRHAARDRWETPAAPVRAAPDDRPVLLRLSDVHVDVAGQRVLWGISLAVRKGEVVAILGANGAGKSTILRAIHGLVHPRAGRILFEGRDITLASTHSLVRAGIVQVQEGHRVFRAMSVLENLRMGAYTRTDRAGVDHDLQRVYGLFPRLRERGDQLAATLSGGEAQMLAMGQALMARPTLLLLDEPTMDVAPILAEQIFATIVEVNRQGVTILLVEQKARRALMIANRAYVLQAGRVVRSGDAQALSVDEEIQAAYLGG